MSSLTVEPPLVTPVVSPGEPGLKKPVARRHDLDALRAIAMLLGIVLHVALSFSTIPWLVTDSRTSRFYNVLFSAIHGFRMPLFFM